MAADGAGRLVQVQDLGHVVLKVRELQRSEEFYVGLLGMQVMSRISDPPMAFFNFETKGTITTLR